MTTEYVGCIQTYTGNMYCSAWQIIYARRVICAAEDENTMKRPGEMIFNGITIGTVANRKSGMSMSQYDANGRYFGRILPFINVQYDVHDS